MRRFKYKASFGNQVIMPATISLICAPLIALLVGALSEQNGDNILTSIMSTDNLGLHYWSSTRNGNLVAIIAWPLQNIEANLKAQVLIKIASGMFLVLWLANQIAEALNVKKYVTSIVALLIGAFLVVKYPDSGESFLYGNGPQMIATVLIAAAINLGWKEQSKNQEPIFRLSRIAFTQLIWIAVGWVSILWLVRAPGFVMIGAAVLLARKNIDTPKIAFLYLLTNAIYIANALAITILLVSQGSEDTSMALSGARDAIRHNSYIWDYLRLAIIVTLLLVIVRDKFVTAPLFLASVWFLTTVVLTAFIGHVQSNHYMPRYFGIGLAIPIIIGVTAAIASLSRNLDLSRSVKPKVLKNVFNIVIVVFAIGTAVKFSIQEIEFGTGKVDKTGTTNSGTPLNAKEFISIGEMQSVELEFVSGGYWDVWPTIFNLRREGLDVIGLVTPGENQKDFDQLLDGGTHTGVCLRVSIENCIQSIETIGILTKGIEINVSEEYKTNLDQGYPYRIVKIRQSKSN